MKNKNIWLLPTDTSRFYKNLLTDKFFILENSFMDVSECNREYQNIYITSDEKIKEGDWYYLQAVSDISSYSGAYRCEGKTTSKLNTLASNCKKIILTTNVDLIKDDVQDIDDEFLEWFVKNPSCEEVEVKKIFTPHEITQDDFCITCDSYGCNLDDDEKYSYKIIIPKKEPKDIHRHIGYDEDGNSLNYQGNILPLVEEANFIILTIMEEDQDNLEKTKEIFNN